MEILNGAATVRVLHRLGALIASLLVFTISGSVYAAAKAEPISRNADVTAVDKLPSIEVGRVDPQKRLNEDAAKLEPGPLRYAIPAKMAITPKSAGTWETLKDGSHLWRYRVQAPGATDLNFGFSRYRLPPGATLHVISETQDYFHGPYTHEDNMKHGQHWTPMVPGNSAIIELYLPAKLKKAAIDLELNHVGMGYRDLFGTPNLARQGACNIDTICPEGDNWRDDIRSASQYSLGGTYFCSGTMIMDVPGSFTPWYITANHCGLTAGNAPSLVVLWNFESATCGALSGGIASDVQTGGAVWRSARTDVDFTLLELNTTPDPAFNVYYAGWDATGSVPPSSVGISHPSNDEKALAFNDDALTTTASCIGGPGTAGTHWNVSNYEQGMTEPGSSGSGIWNTYSADPYNPADRKLVGVLSGGTAACAGGVPNTGFDCYGKFSVAWNDGATAATRLADWLDPAATGTLMINGSDPVPPVCGDSDTTGSEQCDDGNTSSGDGCSSICEIEAGYSCTNPPAGPSVCTLFACGNGFVEPGEQCDDGDLTGGDGCSAACEVEAGFTCTTTPPDGPSVCMTLPMDCSVANVAIPDDSPAGVSNSLTLPGGTLTDLDISLDVTHTYVGDLIVTLTNEDTGTTVTVMDRPGVPAISQFGCSSDNISATLDDAAATPVEDECSATPPAIGGTHSPNNPLAAFNGEDANATWTINVSDNEGLDTGTLVEWCLNVTTDDPDSDGDGVPDGTDNCTLKPNPGQEDSNGDGIGNLCDQDVNNNCNVDFVDFGLMVNTGVLFSTPGDPGWNADFDFNSDGVFNFLDVGQFGAPGVLFNPPGPSANDCVAP